MHTICKCGRIFLNTEQTRNSSYQSAKSTIAGFEIMHMIHKGQIEAIRCVHSELQFISDIMDEAA